MIGTSIFANILVVVFVLLALILLDDFLELAPYLADHIFRSRGSRALEHSLRVSRDRNTIAIAFIIPAILIVNRYRLWPATFLDGLNPDLRLPVVAGVFLVYILIRYLSYIIFKPKRRYEYYVLAYRSAFSLFILLMVLLLVTVGIQALFGCKDLLIRDVLYAEIALVYLFHLVRKMQILSISYSPLTTFLYLCTLELLPTAALVVSAVLL